VHNETTVVMVLTQVIFISEVRLIPKYFTLVFC